MNEYKMAWMSHAQCLSPDSINHGKQIVEKSQNTIEWWANLPPTDTRRVVAHVASLPVAYGAQLAAHAIQGSTFAGAGFIAGAAGVVFVGAMLYWTWSQAELIDNFAEYIIDSSPILKSIFD